MDLWGWRVKLIIYKFPPITQRCEIDLSKKLTLFVGQNNSGKTYLSQLIWGIYSSLSYIKKDDTTSLEQLSIEFTKYIKEYLVKKIFNKDIEAIFQIIIEKIDRESLYSESIFLPSSRLFLPSFYKYIFKTEKDFKDSMFRNFDNINESNKKFYAPSYTQPVDDLIKKLIFSLDKPLEHNRYLDTLAQIIEGNISVDRAEEIGMADISYTHKSGENIPMYLSSSMVNQLSTLYLYFKYWYQKENSFLIMDEPEMNLHPSKKIEIIELLMSFASENKLLIATHSATIAKTIINYIHLFDLKKKNIDIKEFVAKNNLAMNIDISLKSNDVGIYYFNGKTIISYKKDNNSDIHFGTFTEVEELQNRQYEDIMDKLESYDA